MMPYALVAIGLLMVITGINNTYSQFGSQIGQDFSGSKSFVVWVLALGAVGALGYIKDLRTFSHYFMALILISMILANKGVFANFQAALKAGPKAPNAPTDTATGGAPSSGTSATGGDTTGLFGQSPGVPGETGTSGQSKFNQYMNLIPKLFGG